VIFFLKGLGLLSTTKSHFEPFRKSLVIFSTWYERHKKLKNTFGTGSYKVQRIPGDKFQFYELLSTLVSYSNHFHIIRSSNAFPCHWILIFSIPDRFMPGRILKIFWPLLFLPINPQILWNFLTFQNPLILVLISARFSEP